MRLRQRRFNGSQGSLAYTSMRSVRRFPIAPAPGAHELGVSLDAIEVAERS